MTFNKIKTSDTAVLNAWLDEKAKNPSETSKTFIYNFHSHINKLNQSIVTLNESIAKMRSKNKKRIGDIEDLVKVIPNAKRRKI